MQDENKTSAEYLVAIDGSICSQVAAELAVLFAQNFNAHIRGLFVVDETVVLSTFSSNQAELGRPDAPRSRAHLVDWYEKKGTIELEWLTSLYQTKKVEGTTDLLFGGVPDLIRESSERVDLLALGRRGNGHENDPHHLGRNFRAIAHNFSRPIIIGGDETKSPKSILLPYSTSEWEQSEIKPSVMQWVFRLQKVFSCELLVLGIQESFGGSHAAVIGEMEQALDRNEIVDYRLINRKGEPANEILDVCQNYPIDLIVTDGHVYTPLVEWLVGSTLDQVLRKSSVPVFLVHS